MIAAGILDAAEFFDGRLPEAFGGYERSVTKYPVQYPTACSPQAWSTGTPLLLLRTMLGLEPIGRPPHRRPGAAESDRPSSIARHPRTLGPHRRLRRAAGSTPTLRRRARACPGVSPADETASGSRLSSSGCDARTRRGRPTASDAGI